MSKTIVKARKINLAKVCRACLSERGHLREIYPTRIPMMMESCAAVQVSENDGLPGNICVNCFHLIAKFYIFKKKMEKSDRILRQYIIHTQVKQSDIINIALNEAEIHETAETSNSEETSEEILNDELSEEDIPLSQRKIKSSSEHFMKEELMVKDAVKNEALEELDLNNSNIEDFKSDETVQIFSDGPPPLVPLAPVKSIEHVETVVKDLPKDTPPLVPIKPLINIDVLETIIEKNLKYQCNTCNEEFTSVTALKEHTLNTCQSNALQCNICRKEFKDSKKLIGHLKGHMVAKDYGCKICGKRYPNPSTFTVHMRTHTGERPFKCQICNKGFVRWAGVVGHMKTHEEHKPFRCETCGKCFKISSNLERHKILHSGSLPFCCSYCGKCFSQSDNLQLHIRTYHTNERPYLCSECGKGFVSSTRLNRHMWVHSGHKPYVCSSCPKAYSNSNDLKNHARTHQGKKGNEDKNYVYTKKTHDKPHVCHICSKSFSSKNLLNKHIENKHGLTYVEESILQPDEGVSQIFIQYHPQEIEKTETILEYEKVESLHFEKTEQYVGVINLTDLVGKQRYDGRFEFFVQKMEECELKNICRACLTEDGEFQSVFIPDSSTGLSLHLSEMMSACASIQVTLGDGLPEQICSACATNTVNMYLFKLKCEKSDTFLRERLQKVTVYYAGEFLEEPSNENNEELIKPEVHVENDNKLSEIETEIILEEFDNFEFETNKSDSEDFPDTTEELDVANHGITLKQQNKVKEFECDICQKRFSRDDLLIRHKIAHAMKMDEQNLEFDGTYQIENEHSPLMIKSEEFMFSCSDCDVIFIQKEDLDNHINQEHEKKEGNVSCEVCLKKFHKIAHLNRHIKTHSEIKMYKCPLCNKGFIREEQLSHHMNIHSGAKPHTCDICFKGIK
ncbi:hypothetical protein NQ314_011259, partial [Rhamnusium bicolor]